MTNERASANPTGLPSLMKHIQEQQRLAVDLESLLEALWLLHENEIGAAAQMGIISTAHRMAANLNEALDISALPEVRA
ncbi:hypothetical protein [Thalassovita sp.]|uniref:hypothetical protein n=1 Tax=Thalassovita sp. TaxID=1979401 RepID=UPI0029DE8ED6|nr:hypothetical protein [Thalassovita sp.]